MPKFFLDKVQLLTVFLMTLLVGLFFSLATHCYYSDSEIWLLTLSQRAFNPGELMSIYFKWLFHAVTKMASWFVATNLDLYTATRWLYAAIAMAALLFNALSFSRIFENKKLILPVLVVTLTSSLFFNQGFRIRADILALFFHSLFIYTVISAKTFKNGKIVLLIFLNMALLLTTPKSLIFVALHAAVGAFYLFLSVDKANLPKGRAVLLSVFVPCTLGLFFLVILSAMAPDHFLLISLKHAGDFYLKSFDPGLGGASYFHFYDFMYLYRFFKSSVVHSFLFVFWVCAFFKTLILKDSRSDNQSIFDLYTALLIIFIFTYNQKLPFFLGPFLAPVIAHQFCVFWLKVQNFKWAPLFVAAVLLICTVLCVRQYSINLKYNSNVTQRAVIGEIEDYKIKNPQTSLYDIIGLLPLNNSYFYFMGPGEVSRRDSILTALQQTPPDIYLYTLKNIFFEPKLKSFLETEYWQSQPGVWLKAQNFHFEKADYMTNEILRFNNKTYWLARATAESTVFSHTTKKDITTTCVFLNENKQLSQSNTFWVAIPLESLEVSVVNIPLLKLSANPAVVFRFDTAF